MASSITVFPFDPIIVHKINNIIFMNKLYTSWHMLIISIFLQSNTYLVICLTINVDLMEGNRKRKSLSSEDESPSLKYRRLDDVAQHQASSEELECAAGSSASLPAEKSAGCQYC